MMDSNGFLFVDEGAVVAQVEMVDDGTWTTPWPLADVDETGQTLAIPRSRIADGEFAPFAKHPAHVLILGVMHQYAGVAGMRLVAVLGTLVAAVLAARLAERVRPGLGISTLWAVGLVSPLWFDSQLLVGHSLAAAVAAGLALLVFGRPSTVAVAAALSLGFLGPLLRSEFLLLGASLTVVCGWTALRTRDSGRFVLACCPALGGLAAYLAEPMLIRHVMGGGSHTPFRITASALGGLGDRIDAAYEVLLKPGYGRYPAAEVGLLLAFLGAALLGGAIGQKASVNRGLVRFGVAGLVAGVLVWLAFGAHLVPGILVAALPLTVALAAVAVGHRVRPGLERQLAMTVVLVAVTILTTQYGSGGGSVEWGWRYAAIALPVAGPVCVAVFGDLLRRLRQQERVLVLGAVVVCSTVVAVGAMTTLSAEVSRTAEFRSDIVQAVGPEGPVLTTDPGLGLFVWELVVEGRLSRSEPSRIGHVASLLDVGRQPVRLVWLGSPSTPPPGDYGPYEVVGAKRVGTENAVVARLETAP